MYHALLTRKYLTSKILPLLAAGAVFLCTASVLFVWSIMGGFLTMLLNSGRAHVGDVMIEWPGAGFGYYQELVKDLEARPEILAAAPTIESAAIVQYPDKRNNLIVLLGVEPESYNRLTDFREFLWWKPLDKPLAKDKGARDIRIDSASEVLSKWIAPRAMQARDRALELAKDGIAVTEMNEVASSLRSIAEEARRVAAASSGPTPAVDEVVKFLREQGGLCGAVSDRVYKGAMNGSIPLDRVSEKRGGKDAINAASKPLLFDALSDLTNGITRLYRQPEQAHAFETALELGKALTAINPLSGAELPAIVLGTEHSTYNQRRREDFYDPMQIASVRQPNGQYSNIEIPVANYTVGVNLLPNESGTSTLDVVARTFSVVNELRTGIYEIDSRFGLVRLDYLQRFLRMDESDIINDEEPNGLVIGPGGTPIVAPPTIIGKNPARVTTVLVRGNKGVELEDVRTACREVYATFAERHALGVPSVESIKILTWRDKKATLVAAVEKEIVMVVMVMGVISVTVSFLILAIFWAIVREKTKDIGILRAIGASRAGVMGVWLAYALIIGLIGSVLGGIVAHIAVWNINPIHDWLGETLGISIWSPEIYYINKIPNEVEPWRAAVVMVAGVFFSVLGALIPSVRAAYMDPVKALRFE